VVVGTIASEIYEVNLLSRTDIHKLVSGHFVESGDVMGLAVHPRKPLFVTTGDDNTVRVWNSKARKLKHLTSVGSQVRAAAFSPDGFQLSVGTYDGRVKVLTDDLSVLLVDTAVADEWIKCMSYSPNSQLLAAGSNDNNIYVLETKNYSVQTVCRGHESRVSNLDFSVCSSILQSSSRSCDLLFWTADDGKQIKSQSQIRDIEWASWTSTLGWPVQVI
jgi:microtubule-associated protein-like 6